MKKPTRRFRKTCSLFSVCACLSARQGLRRHREPNTGYRASQTGFTLVELIMTIVVVGIIAVPLSLTLSQHVVSTFLSQDLTAARNLARFEMEKVLNTPYADIATATTSNDEGYAYDVSRTVTYAQGSAGSAEGLKKVAVDVTKTGNASILCHLMTYIAKNVNIGL